MYVACESFAAVCAYLNGFDDGRDGGPLIGFKPWLVVRQDGGDNLAWVGLVMAEALESPRPEIEQLSAEQNRQCIEKLGEILAQFFADRSRRTVTAILHDYAKWLLRKKWYTGPLRSKT